MRLFFHVRRDTVRFFNGGKLHHHTRQHKLELTAWPLPVARVQRDGCWRTASRFLADKALSLCMNDRASRLIVCAEKSSSQPGTRMLLSGQFVFAAIYDGAYFSSHNDAIGNAQDFFDTIPATVLSELDRYYDRHWHLLNLFARCSGAIDLSRSNPGLFYALANHWLFRPKSRMDPVEEAAKHVNQKQKTILEWLGVPATEPVRRILAKIDPGTLYRMRDSKFWQLFKFPEVMKLLAHLEQIDSDVLELVMDAKYRPYLTPRLLAETIRDKHLMEERESSVWVCLAGIQALSSRFKERSIPKKFCSLRRLIEVHDDLCRQDRLQIWHQQHAPFAMRQLGFRFPCPPFAGTETIRPIETPHALVQEGFDMKHCVATKIDSVAAGRVYVYQVSSPVRATLSMYCQTGQKVWYPGELVLEANRKVDSALHDVLFFEVFHSPATGKATGGKDNSVAPVSPTVVQMVVDGSGLARCDLGLADGQRAPPEWNYRNPKQLPLLASAERQLIVECLRVFGGGNKP